MTTVLKRSRLLTISLDWDPQDPINPHESRRGPAIALSRSCLNSANSRTYIEVGELPISKGPVQVGPAGTPCARVAIVAPEDVEDLYTFRTLAGFSGDAARFHAPRGVAVDREGNLYVTDSVNATIRRVTPEGVVTTVAGAAREPNNTDGAAAVARFYGPIGIALDNNGALYIADTDNNTIRVGTPRASPSRR